MTFDPVLAEALSQPDSRYFFPATGSEAEWNAAFFRLEDYLRALHVHNKVHQSQIILEMLAAAAAKHRENPDESPTSIVMRECHERTCQWFEHILEHPDRFPVAGLLPLFLADGVRQWPNVFLRNEVPQAFRQAVQQHDVAAAPDIQLSRMIPRPLDASPFMEGIFHDGGEKLDAVTALVLCMAAGSVVATVFFFLT